MNRREFLGWVGVGSLASSLPIAIAACSPTKVENNPTSSSSPKADGFQSVGTVAELDKNGQLLNKQFAGSSVLVIRDPAANNQLIAVKPICTHTGCTVAWEKQQKNFICPCHDSKFATDGKVLKGPAKDSLPVYTAKIEGDAILVKQG